MANSMSREDLIVGIKLLLEQHPSDDALVNTFQSLTASLTPPRIPSEFMRITFPLIVEYLPVKDFLSLTQVCKETKSQAKRIMKARVNKLLKPYGGDEVFDYLLNGVGCVVSGSSILWLTEGEFPTWSPGDLDLYTPRGAVRAVTVFLSTKGYKPFVRAQDEVQNSNGDEYIADRCRLRSITKLVKGNSRIDVLESLSDSAVDPLTWFHSTIVMNYLTANSLVLLYPRTTLARIGVIQDGKPSRGPGWRSRYEARGYQFFRLRELQTAFYDTICPARVRTPGDRYCLTVPYGRHDDDDGAAAADNMEWAVTAQATELVGDASESSAAVQWTFDATTSFHPYCTAQACKLKLYIDSDHATIVEYAARRTYCDLMQTHPFDQARQELEQREEFKEAVRQVIKNIIEYSQAPLEMGNICKHGGRCIRKDCASLPQHSSAG